MSKSLGNGVDLGEQIDAVRRRRGAADDDLRRPAGGRHRLGRRLAGRCAQVPGPGLAAGRRRGLGGRRRPVRAATLALRRQTHRTVHEAGAADRVAQVQRRGRPADGAGQRHPQGGGLRCGSGRSGGPRGGRGDRRSCSAWSRRTPPRTCGRGSATSRRSPAPGGREVDESLLVEESVTCVVQVAGKVRDRLEVAARHRPRTRCASMALASEKVQRRRSSDRDDPHRHRAGAPSGQRRAGLTPDAGRARHRLHGLPAA